MTHRTQTRLGVITGLAAEAKCLHAISPVPFCSGGSTERAEGGARKLAGEGVDGLVSFGIAGGLDPSLLPGSLVLAEAVAIPGGARIATDETWRMRFQKACEGKLSLTVGVIAGADRALTCVAEKRALSESTGALAVDMESHVVAKVAARTGLPFLALRAVADPADRNIPRAALSGLCEDGRIQALPVLMQLFQRPWELPGLLRLAIDAGKAMAALRRVAELGLSGPGL